VTTDQKIQAVEEFLDWRNNAHPTDAPETLLEKWRAVLEQANDAALLAELRKEAPFALTDPAEAMKLVGRLIHG
jgi:hypothetical protein